ncbi:hypothetical protein [Tardisphaera saccharovorans]
MTIVKKVLTPYEGIEGLVGGVGTPNVVYDVRRDKHWLVFTGWSDPTGMRREIWAAQMMKDLSLDRSTLKRVIPSEFPERESYTNNTVRAIYNAVRDQFILTTTHGKGGYIYYFRPDWTLITYRKIVEGVGDHSIPVRPLGCYGKNHDALTIIPRGQDLVLGQITDVDDSERVKFTEMGVAAEWGESNDVLDLVTVPRLAAFVEEDATNKWLLHSFLGPSLDDIYSGFLSQVGLLHGSLMPLLGLSDEFVQVGHPHYTLEPDGKPKLFFAAFRDSWSATPSTSREGYAHEIWEVEVGPELFKNESYGVLSDKAISQTRQSPSKWYFVGGARSLLLMVTGVKEGARVELRERANVKDEDATSLFELKSNSKIVVPDPAPYVSVSADPSVSVTLTATYRRPS